MQLFDQTIYFRYNTQNPKYQGGTMSLPRMYLISGYSINEIHSEAIALVSQSDWIVDSKEQGLAKQLDAINYTLLPQKNTYNKVSTLRTPQSEKYFAGALLYFFSGSNNITEAKNVPDEWKSSAFEQGQFRANYGKFILEDKYRNDELTQYEYCLKLLKDDFDCKKAVVKIMNFSCTFALHFFVKNNKLNCIVSSRSTDTVLGLPYDLGVFSFFNELLFNNLIELGKNIELGYTMIKSDLSQLYKKHESVAEEIIRNSMKPSNTVLMPQIEASKTLEDFKNHTSNSEILNWCRSYF